MLGKILLALIGVLIAVSVMLVVSAIYAWPVQLLVNYLVGGVQVLTFKKAWAITLLCALLFKSSK